MVDAIRQHPYSVLLLDEIREGAPHIFNFLLQVMDHATLTILRATGPCKEFLGRNSSRSGETASLRC